MPEIQRKELQAWIVDNAITIQEAAKKIGISRPHLYKILRERSKHTPLVTCQKIYVATGLKPWEYLDGMEDLKEMLT